MRRGATIRLASRPADRGTLSGRPAAAPTQRAASRLSQSLTVRHRKPISRPPAAADARTAHSGLGSRQRPAGALLQLAAAAPSDGRGQTAVTGPQAASHVHGRRTEVGSGRQRRQSAAPLHRRLFTAPGRPGARRRGQRRRSTDGSSPRPRDLEPGDAQSGAPRSARAPTTPHAAPD